MIDVGDGFTGVVNFTVESSRITGRSAISNPRKLTRIDGVASISRT